MCGAYIRFWPTLIISEPKIGQKHVRIRHASTCIHAYVMLGGFPPRLRGAHTVFFYACLMRRWVLQISLLLKRLSRHHKHTSMCMHAHTYQHTCTHNTHAHTQHIHTLCTHTHTRTCRLMRANHKEAVQLLLATSLTWHATAVGWCGG